VKRATDYKLWEGEAPAEPPAVGCAHQALRPAPRLPNSDLFHYPIPNSPHTNIDPQSTIRNLTVDSPLHRSFRVEQVAGMFDVPLAERLTESFQVELPPRDGDWQIGAIVGRSGSGKTTVARQVFGDCLWRPAEWPRDRAMIDGFPPGPTRPITELLTAVGLSSPPAWVKPFHVLSQGQQFRAELARALLESSKADSHVDNRRSTIAGSSEGRGAEEMGSTGDEERPPAPRSGPPPVCFDEFTSVVDRAVAKIGSAAVARAIRRGRVAARFVAVTCHYDVLQWLTPDWVLDMATGRLARGCLRRPDIKLRLYRCRHAAWRLFKRTHYLSGGLSRGAATYLALWEETPVAFVAVVNGFGGRRPARRISRVVVLPDFQGVGIGAAVTNRVAAMYRDRDLRMRIVTGHPAMIAFLRDSPAWRIDAVRKTGWRPRTQQVPPRPGEKLYRQDWRQSASAGRAVVSAEYVGH